MQRQSDSRPPRFGIGKIRDWFQRKLHATDELALTASLMLNCIKYDVSERGIARIALEAPRANALNCELLKELIAVLKDIQERSNVRAIVIESHEKAFCSGADINWLWALSKLTKRERIKQLSLIDTCLHALHSLPIPSMAIVDGAVKGGGMGPMAACDIVIVSEENASFQLPEVKLGLFPWIISPYVIARIGSAAFKRLAQTGEKLDAKTAQELGLVDVVVSSDKLPSTVDEYTARFESNSPGAVRAIAGLTRRYDLPAINKRERRKNVRLLAEAIAGADAQNAMRKFLERQKSSES